VKNLVAHFGGLKHYSSVSISSNKNLKHKVNSINQSHQQSRYEENDNNHYNQNEAQKIFKSGVFLADRDFRCSDEGVIGNPQIIEQRDDRVD
jgi:hypothetical protein